MVSITHGQNIICTKTHFDGTTHEHPIICRQLFAGHVVGSRPMKRKGKNASNDNTYFYTNITYFFAVIKVGILHIQDELLLLQTEPVSIF